MNTPITIISRVRKPPVLHCYCQRAYHFQIYSNYINEMDKGQTAQQSAQFPYDQRWEGVQWQAPAKRIIQFGDVVEYQQRPIHHEYLDFLADCQRAIVGKKISDTKSNAKFAVFDPLFAHLEQLLEKHPPIDQPMRFGNRAFKDWHKDANEYLDVFLEGVLPEKIRGAKRELWTYAGEGWGSNVRLDYGSGHEMSFMYFCWALFRLGFCGEGQLQELVRLVFYRYMGLMRKVQLRYNLQPAGSHGVWGLDDYHFLPFLLGAAQLVGHPQLLLPQSVNNVGLVDKYAGEYMYINCIKFIMQVKKGVPFAESSPVLNNISGAASWQKVMGGMIKMYKAEVLGKHPVIKHQYFGTIIPY